MLLLSPSDRFCRASRLRRVPVSGWPAAVTFLCAYVPGFCLQCLGRLGGAPLSRIGRTQDSDPARRPAAVSERSGIADLVAPTAVASRWRDRVPFVPFAAPLCSLFPRRVTCAPFENFYFVILNPFFRRRRARNHSSPFPSRTPRICPMPALLRTGLLLCAAVQAPSAPVDANPRRDIEFASFAG